MIRRLRLWFVLPMAVLAWGCVAVKPPGTEDHATGRAAAVDDRPAIETVTGPAPGAVALADASQATPRTSRRDGPRAAAREDARDGRRDADRGRPAERERERTGATGRPLPGGDHPGEAAKFRSLSLQDENGTIPPDGLLRGKAQIDEMRAVAPVVPLDPAADITGGGWTWLGPGNIGGRVRSLIIHPNDASTMFAGSVSGGIWKSTNGGTSWAPVDDFMANLAVSTIVMQPGTPTTMYAGTGEGNFNGDAHRGLGIFKSTDGGSTWTQLASTNSANFHYINRIDVSPNGSTILAAARTGIWRSTDAGGTFQQVRVTSVGQGMMQVAFHPTDSTRAIAAGGNGDAYYSTNGGASWIAATGLPGGSFATTKVAYAPSAPTTVYASVAPPNFGTGGFIYKSVDGGVTYSLIFNSAGGDNLLGGQGWYNNALWVNPLDPTFLIVGGVDLFRSTTGGAAWAKISDRANAPQSAHADQHVIVTMPGFNNSTNRTVLFGNDGGVYQATDVSTVGGTCPGDCSTGWTALNNNLGITQFYGGAGHAGSGKLLGGTQDNGTLMYTPAGGPQAWTTTFGGDGGYAAIDPTNANTMYGEYTFMAVHRSLTGTAAGSDWINGMFWTGTSYVCKPLPFSIPDVCVGGSIAANANFIAPFILDPNNANRLLAGGRALWRTDDAATPNTPDSGPSWASIKSPLPSNSFISAIAVAPGDADTIWVGHNNGDVYAASDGTTATPTWFRTDNGATPLPNRMVTRVTIDPSNPNTVYVTFGGFSPDNIYRTTDGGIIWASVVGSGVTAVPAIPVRDLEVHPSNSTWLYAATELGMFASTDGGTTWSLPHDGPANVSVEELFFMGPDLVAVTYGRGMYKQAASTTGSPGVSGQITDAATSAGLANAWVDFLTPSGTFVASATSTSSGSYQVNLPVGTYRARTGNFQGYLNELYDNIPCVTAAACAPEAGTPIVVGTSVTSGIDFALDAGSASIAGTVTNASNGAPVANVAVSIYNSSGAFVIGRSSDASGNYIAGLPAGTYRARTSNGQGLIDELYDDIACRNCDVTTGTPISATVGLTTTGIDFALAPGGRLSGTVTNAATGGALANVSVLIFNNTGAFVTWGFTDASGNYLSYEGLPTGTYFALTSNSAGFIDEVYNDIPCVGCNVTTGTPIAVTAGATTENINFALATGGRISGRVTNAETSAPLANINVQIYNSTGAFVTGIRTDAAGNYTTNGLSPGSYFARTSNFIGFSFLDEVYNDIPCVGCNVTTGTPIAVTAGATTENINFALVAGGRISGRVINAETSSPLASLNVQIYDGAGAFVTGINTDASGNYTTNGLSPGTYFARTSNFSGFLDELYDDIACVSCDVTTGTPIAVAAGATTPNVNFALAAGARISGAVTEAATSAPLQNVSVSIYDTTGVWVAGTSTDATGTYTSSGLPAGTYFARTFNTMGLLEELYDDIACLNCDVTTGTPITATSGLITGIDFALAAGGRISGKVTNAATGAAAANVAVYIYDSTGAFATFGSTDASGNYLSFAGLPTGTYFAQTSNSSGFIDEVYDDIPCAGCDVTTGTPIAVTAGATTGNITFGLALGGRVSGRVTDASTGNGIANVSVEIHNSTGAFMVSGFTDASGSYTTPAVPAGTYFARTSNGLAFFDELYHEMPCVNCVVTTGTPITVTVGATTADIDFTLTAGGRISGTVTNAATGAGLADVFVGIFNSTGAFVSSGFTDTSGNYLTFAGLPTGTYFAATFNSSGFLDELYNELPCMNCTVTTGTPITVTAGGTASNINFTLTAGGRIAGMVTNAATGAPLANVSVSIFNASGASVLGTSTDAAGSYVTSGLAPGTYFARTFNSMGLLDELYNEMACINCTVTTGTPITVTAGGMASNINFTLDAGGRVSGRVTNAATGAGLANVNVNIFSQAGTYLVSTNTDGAGNYTTPGLPGGTYFANTFNTLGFVDELYNDILCPGCNVTTGTPITVTMGATTNNINFALAAGGSITGRVTNAATSAPLADLNVQIYNATGAFVVSNNTDVSGNFTMSALPAGTYFARTFNGAGFFDELYNEIPCSNCVVTTGTPITVTVGATTSNINFTLAAGGRISGTVTNAANGAGLSNVTVWIYNSTGGFVTSGFTDASGAYLSSTGLPTGTYFARTFNSSGFIDELYNDIPCPGCSQTTGTPITVTVGATTNNINFALAAGGRISGRVTNAATSAPLANVGVQIYNATGAFVAGANTDAAGNYTMPAVPAGTYFARTFNGAGFFDELYNEIPCSNCVVTTGTPITVTVGATTSNINFTLAAGGRISGTVTNAASGAPLPSVSVSIFNASGALVLGTNTDASGNYTTSGLAAGTYYARTFNASGFFDELYNDIPCVNCVVTTGTPITVTAGATTNNINFTLTAGGRISGTVTNAATGAAVASVSVYIYNSTGALVTAGFTDASGAYLSSGLPTGTYFARTFDSSPFLDELYNEIPCSNCVVTTGTPITVTVGATTSNINFTLVAGGRISGTVTNAATGAAVASVSVPIYNSTGGFVTSGFTDASGAYLSAAGLPTGTYFARTFNASGFVDELYNEIPCVSCVATTGTPITVTVGSTASNINFTLTAGGRISGTVTNAATGAALSNVSVSIFNGSGGSVLGMNTDAAGNYTTPALPAGTYFARTSNSAGFLDELYNEIPCVSCVVTTGTPITVTVGSTASNINFTLAVPPALTLSVNGTLPPTEVSATGGSTVAVQLGGNLGSDPACEYIAVYLEGAADNAYADWRYLNGTKTCSPDQVPTTLVNFPVPILAGRYEFRYWAGGIKRATSTKVVVTGVTLTVNGIAPPTELTVFGGSSVGVALVGSLGSDPACEWVALYPEGAADSGYVNWFYLNGTKTCSPDRSPGTLLTFPMPTAAGRYEFRYWVGGIKRATSTKVVVVTLTVNGVAPPTEVTVSGGASVAVQLLGNLGSDPACEWMALYLEGGADNAYVNWFYLNGTKSCSPDQPPGTLLTFPMPTTAGRYEFRYWVGGIKRAISTKVVVGAPLSLTVNGVAPPTEVSVSGSATVAVQLQGSLGSDPLCEWIALYPEGAADNAYVNWFYLNGTKSCSPDQAPGTQLNFLMPTAAGRYEFRYWAGGIKRATSTKVVIGGVSLTVNNVGPPTEVTVTAGATVSVQLAGALGSNPTCEWIAVYPEGAADNAYANWFYLNGTKSCSPDQTPNTAVNFTMSTAGRFQFRYWVSGIKRALSAALVVAPSLTSP